MDTIFDRILAKQIPAQVVYESEHVLAFRDINPQAKVHVLVIPKKRATHVGDLSAWPASDAGTYLHEIAQVAAHLGLSKTGYRVVFNTGDHGCQSVHYVHAHILGGEPLSGAFGK